MLNLANSLKNPKTVRFGDLVNLTSSEWISPGSRSFYQTWMYYRISNALSPFLLILLVLTLAHYSRARSTKYFLYWTSIALGFIYFIMQQICLALGEMGILPSLLAAGLPQILVLFFVLNGSVIFEDNGAPNFSTFAAHVRYDQDCSGWASDGDTTSTTSGSCGATVPEPSIVWLLGSGLLMIGFVRRFRT